ncbi:MAG: transglycosylase SLT domain-containing protein [Burkholderiaceae bacterium]|nr:transglycosylase SLT domain-containing protein [Burkholderiaceae bacterium]
MNQNNPGWKMALALAASVWLSGCALMGAQGGSAATPQATAVPEPQPPVVFTSPVNTGRTQDMPPVPAQEVGMPPVSVQEVRSAQVASLDAPADLWDRIRRGFAMPDLEGDAVRKQEAWYAARPQYIERMAERSRMYLFHIVEELELRGMPTELALLPFVESAYNPQALSGAKAAGIWQFMPATGRHFDLKQNIFRDDRRDVLGSTRAALDYLDKLHTMFGNWQLALAAYNCGEGCVARAIKNNQNAGLGTSYAELPLSNETRNYFPKLQAIKNIVARPDAFGAKLPDIGNHPFFDTVNITRDIDVTVAAQLAEIRLEDFKALNPSHHKPVIFATGTPQVLLPWDNAARFEQNLKKHDPAKLASWTAWVAPAAMSASEAARRQNMDPDKFRQVNGLPKDVIVKAGSTLLVPRRNGSPVAVSSQVVNNASLSFTPVLRRTGVRARKNDTIATLAARYDLPASTVAGWNKTTPHARLRQGQTVTLYLPAHPKTAQASKHKGHSKNQAGSKPTANKNLAGKSNTRKSDGSKDKKKHH